MPERRMDNHFINVVVPEIIGLTNLEELPPARRSVALDAWEFQQLINRKVIDSEREELARLDMGRDSLSRHPDLADAFEGTLDWILIEAANKAIQREGYNFCIVEYSLPEEEDLELPDLYHYLLGWLSDEEIEVLKLNADMIFSRVYVD